MKIVFVPKERTFNYEDPNIRYTGSRLPMSFMMGYVADVDNSFDFSAVDYKEISEEDSSRTIKFFMNYSGYVKVTQGTENSTLEITASKEDIAGMLTRVKYYLTDEDKTKAFTFTKENILWMFDLRVDRVKKILDDFNRSEYESSANLVRTQIVNTTEMKDIFVIGHKYFGMEAPPAIVEEFNLTKTTLVI
jgi:hypothetical protein